MEVSRIVSKGFRSKKKGNLTDIAAFNYKALVRKFLPKYTYQKLCLEFIMSIQPSFFSKKYPSPHFRKCADVFKDLSKISVRSSIFF